MCSPDIPDTSKMQEAAVKSADLGESALKWYQDVYREQTPAREAATAKALEVSDAQLASMKNQDRIASETYDYSKGTYRPVEQGIVKDAMSFNTEAERERRAGLAGADVAQAFGAARSQGVRQLGRMGVNPSDGRMLATIRELGASEALGTAYAKNKSRADSETLGRALKMDAASLGRNLPSQQTAAATTAINAGNASAANGLTPLQIAQAGTGQMGAGFDAAQRGYQTSGNMYGNIAGIQQQANASGNATAGALGTAAGAALSTVGTWGPYLASLSDENAKKDITPVSEEDALEAVTATPVKEWTYRKGEGDGGSHVGPMAQDVKRTMGSKAAPGGKMIDLISMNGITMKAVQALNKKIDNMAAQMGVPV